MKYHFALRLVHWLMALCIVGLIIFGFFMVHVAPLEMEHVYYPWHRTFGVLVFLLFPIRFLLRRITEIPPLPEGMKAHEKKASHMAHIALYLLMVIVPVSGYISSSSGGHDVQFFNWVVPNVFDGRNEWLFQLAGPAHMIIAYVMTAIVVLHVAGALKHRFFEEEENDVMGRMLFSRRKKQT